MGCSCLFTGLSAHECVVAVDFNLGSREFECVESYGFLGELEGLGGLKEFSGSRVMLTSDDMAIVISHEGNWDSPHEDALRREIASFLLAHGFVDVSSVCGRALQRLAVAKPCNGSECFQSKHRHCYNPSQRAWCFSGAQQFINTVHESVFCTKIKTYLMLVRGETGNMGTLRDLYKIVPECPPSMPCFGALKKSSTHSYAEDRQLMKKATLQRVGMTSEQPVSRLPGDIRNAA